MIMLMMMMHDEMMTLSVAAEESGFVNETLGSEYILSSCCRDR